MKDYFKPKTWLITILMFAMALGLSSAVVYYEFGLEKNIKITRASAGDNVTGWAWNATGWISFNCDHTTDGTSPPTNTCGTSEYGVKIDLTTGYFSGYAWSSNIGWISFNRSDTGDPPANPYKNGSGPIAVYDFSAPYQVTGWAKILSMGDNGWIKLRKSIGSEPDFGLSIEPATGNFSGWAWNANDGGAGGIGWISFNCANESPVCSGTNYKVVGNVNRPPTVDVITMTAPNWSYNDAGQYGARNAILRWTFNDLDTGSSESAYQIIVNTSDSLNTPFFDSGKCVAFILGGRCTVAPSVGQFPLQLALLNISSTLDYNKVYYWWVKVWDNKGAESGWTQYNRVQDTPLEANDGALLTFTTYKHEMPDVDFDWFPLKPSEGEEVKFTDKSKVYSSSDPSLAVDCADSSVSCEWLWTATNASIVGATTASPIMIFNSTSNPTVTLEIKDQDGYRLSLTKSIEVNVNLPGWKEVKP